LMVAIRLFSPSMIFCSCCLILEMSVPTQT